MDSSSNPFSPPNAELVEKVEETQKPTSHTGSVLGGGFSGGILALMTMYPACLLLAPESEMSRRLILVFSGLIFVVFAWSLIRFLARRNSAWVSFGVSFAIGLTAISYGLCLLTWLL